MKRIIKCFVCLLVTVALSIGIFIAVKLNKKFPDKIVYSEHGQAFSENGMYYCSAERLYFMDNATGKEAVVCNRANCEHNNNTCNAYIPGMGIEMLVYGDYIYISYFDSYVFFNEDGEASYEGDIKLIRLGINGEGRKEIYTANSGAVSNMIAMGDTIYFAAHTTNGEFQLNIYNLDNAIYAYNIRWNKLKCIKNYAHAEGINSESVTLVGSRDKDTLYVDYGYVEGEGTEEIIKNTIQEVNIKSGQGVVLRMFEDAYPNFFVNQNKKYVQTSDFKTDILTMSECDDNFIGTKELFTAEDARVDWLGGYMHILTSDYLKALYDYEEDRWYIAKTSFTQEGTYMSNVYKVDRDKNIVYIDVTDYTGYKPGDMLPGDISNKAVRDWSIFLEENFIPYEDLTEEQLKSLTWIDIK